MSENISQIPRRALHLVLEGFPAARLDEVTKSTPGSVAEIFHLTDATAREAVEKIFEADAVAVWTNLE